MYKAGKTWQHSQYAAGTDVRLRKYLEKGKDYEHEKKVIYCCTYLGSGCAANLYYKAD